MRKHYTGRQRSDLVSLVRNGRATVREAAERLGVAPSTAYYWMRGAARVAAPKRLRPAKERLAAAPAFVRVVPSGDFEVSVAVRIGGGVEIQLRHGFDADLLRAVVEALRGGAA
jgi:transposase-like protein